MSKLHNVWNKVYSIKKFNDIGMTSDSVALHPYGAEYDTMDWTKKSEGGLSAEEALSRFEECMTHRFSRPYFEKKLEEAVDQAIAAGEQYVWFKVPCIPLRVKNTREWKENGRRDWIVDMNKYEVYIHPKYFK